MADALAALAAYSGIVPSYTDQTKRRRRTGRATQRTLLAALGLSATTEREAAEVLGALKAQDHERRVPPWIVTEPGVAPTGVVGARDEWALLCETGEVLEGRGDSLPILPLGLHSLTVGNSTCAVICAPRQLPLPPRVWGLMLPLHTIRDEAQGGLGDFHDLAKVAEGVAPLGVDFLGLNPIHAGFFDDPGGFSPYTPSHRRRLSAFHIPDGEPNTPSDPVMDYASAIPARLRALNTAYQAFEASGGDPEFTAFLEAEGPTLDVFCAHQALAARHGAYWCDWPAALRDPATLDLAQIRADLGADMRFHAWLQWRAEAELGAANIRAKEAGMALGLYLDLAVGTHPYGAETWEDRDSFAFGASLGAPPDAFSADGQSWGLAPFNPRALVTKGFRPLAETLRCQMALSGAVRIDHILGFDRAFWVPDDGAPGAYVRMPREAMLAVVRMEAARVGAVVVGEDLGNVPRGLRQALEASGILSCRLMLFERARGEGLRFKDPKDYPTRSIASFSTHDLPTWLGWRSGHDIDARVRTGDITEDIAKTAHMARAKEVAGFDAMVAHDTGTAISENVDVMHHALGQGASALAMVQVENVLEVEAQPNLPGTVDTYPNWKQRLPVGPSDLPRDERMIRTAGVMNAARETTPRE